MSIEEVSCPSCGRSEKINRHAMNATLVAGLRKLRMAAPPGIPVVISEIPGMSRSLLDNFSKLQHFDLVAHHGTIKSGVWSITDLGRRWLSGRTKIPSWVETGDGGVVRSKSEVLISIRHYGGGVR